MKRGCFITLEGGEGAGKSTQALRLARELQTHGHDVVTTREPGGTEEAEHIRAFLLSEEGAALSGLSQALLHNAARAEHLHNLIRPSLEKGAWVICDRFMDSTRAYQGAALGTDDAALDVLEGLIVGNTVPDLTLVIDLPVSVGLGRALRRAQEKGEDITSYERMGENLHEKMRDAFLRIARSQDKRCAIIDGTQSPDKVAADIWQTVQARLKP